ncbi:hypothetical protein E2P81_ATG00783 [Venturia nashicola]|uniref:Uncharacterized protein n=1 Tax=Venturia nashicola TaxID=86259 RepID=A0A4Z1PAA9_9PEZI|nr:hypothetical protein E6O75_ATG00801 [Venturia nashicola]TLD38240.1 hypothetical protein E2P81_ATG00783 [Venturia nashicola]
MPTYNPLQTKVHLRIANLADTTTPVPERQKGKYATSVTEKAENILKSGRILKETPIPLGDDGSKLHYIGPEGTPFYLMHASEEVPKPLNEGTLVERALRKGYELLELEESRPRKPVIPSFGSISTLSSLDPDVDFSEFERAKGNPIQESSPKVSAVPSITPRQFALEIEKRRAAPMEGHGLPGHVPDTSAPLPDHSAPPTNQHSLRDGSSAQEMNPSLIPQAIGLALTFSDATFLPSFKKPYGLQDIKTDVYVNGELTGSTTAPARRAADAKTKAAEESREPLFSGKRVHRMAERAMVLVPPEQNADGSLRLRNRSKASLAGPEERWSQINAALLGGANMMGFDKSGERPPVGAFLASLAAIPMPPAVEKFQKPGGPKFGVIDVVISVGTGWKLGPTSPYIMEPTRSVNDHFKEPKPEKNVATNDGLPMAEDSALAAGTNISAADVDKEGPPEVCGIADSREEGKKDPDPQSNEQQAENAQAGSIRPPELPQVAEDPQKTQFPKQAEGSIKQALVETPLPLARPLTPPTDDLPRAFEMGLRIDDKLHPPVRFPLLPSSSVGSSSPERDTPSGQPKRLRRAIGNSEMRMLFGPEFESLPLLHSSQGSMPPPKTPLSSFEGSRKRKWKSDAITSPKSQRPVKRNRGSSISTADSPGKPFLTRNGFEVAKAAVAKPHKPSAKTPLIHRIVIKNQGETIVDKQLEVPLQLSHKAVAPETPKVPSSPVYPLHEDVVFGTRRLGDIVAPSMKPAKAIQPPTPHASSSPTRKPPKSRSSSPVKKSQAPVGHPTPVNRQEQKNRDEKARTQARQIIELDESWKMPELSKDCVVSFAEEGPWRTSGNGKGGVWRNVRSARPGYFKETDVLFGVRYVIS